MSHKYDDLIQAAKDEAFSLESYDQDVHDDTISLLDQLADALAEAQKRITDLKRAGQELREWTDLLIEEDMLDSPRILERAIDHRGAWDDIVGKR